MTPTSLNVLVTGAAGGMCRGINARLAAAGHTVLCADLNLEAAQAAADQITAAGGSAYAFELDVTSDASVARLLNQVQESVGDIQVLVNAAGILDRKYLADHEEGSFERAIEINLNGPFRMIKAFAPQLVEQGWGRIINISSIAGTTGYPYPSYAASKAGLSNLTRSLLIDFWGTGVTVNSICPGVVDTNMVIQEVRDQVKRKVPTEQIVQPEEIGAMINFLLSEDAKNVNGADLLIDGGATRVFSLFDR
ncbi:SDR family oxidoreductase [Corynebacterium sp. YIM 101645]|uniref:3-oxoacyl-[acyl-carrier-protein] reductase MabA n=1 Tax=Corynebacterium lemuris TaxID=1859292 RepID=A0ABT2FSC1_9CORY|nr:SDR family NAD(P)-dependent oxidoreductase [Corynebacterium lemuris]MCS5478120.1 SDR family oxidoreductase [Corynebacterium lemuris]